MAKFVFVFRTPSELANQRANAGSYTASPETLAAWQAWYSEMAANVADPGSAVLARSTLGETGDSTALGGYSTIDVDDLEAAVTLAEGCPVLQYGGGVEVGELTTVNTT
jgi:hypothetical protein